MNGFARFLNRHGSTILSCLSAAGTIAAAALAVKTTPEAVQRIESDRRARDGDLSEGTLVEAVKSCWQCYVPAASVAAGTLLCIFGANALDKRRQASLVSACALLEGGYRAYREKIRTLYGKDADEKVKSALAQDSSLTDDAPLSEHGQVFYEEHLGKFFESTKEAVLAAEYHFNRNYVLRGYACLNEFFDFLGLPPVDAGDALGWSGDVGWERYGYQWIDFEHRTFTLDDGLECIAIEMPFPPTADYLDPWGEPA